MNILTKILWEVFAFFTPFVDPFEIKVYRFCNWVTSYRSKYDVEKRLLTLMQENLIVTSIWFEKRYKNYTYLTKSRRREIYRNAQLMMADFDTFNSTTRMVVPPPVSENKVYLQKVMDYFSPSRGKYVYKEGVSFGKLLTCPTTENYVGDCNQIVTLYAAYYARKFPITDLQIKLIPGHVCLHFKGDDIEATNATWQKYDKYDYIAPISELVATNLLDISEQGEKTQEINPEIFVKGAQLAAVLSQKKDIVENNIRVAYHNLCVSALAKKDIQKALFYARKIGDQQLLQSCYATEYNILAEKVSTVKTVQDAKLKKDTYRKMIELARLLQNSENAQSIQKILDQINRS